MTAREQDLSNANSPDFGNSEYEKLVVPGFGCKLDTVLPLTKRFRHGIGDASYDCLTAKELAMLRLMDAITDKPNWKMKIRDPKILGKWRVEAMTLPLMSEAAFSWCIEELRDTTDWEQNSFVLTLNTGSRCAKGDDIVPKSLMQSLQSQVLPLLRQPKDWHPDSNEQVLDLVHPSLYPFVYGKTRIKSQGSVELNEALVSDRLTEMIPALTIPELGHQSSPWQHTNFDQWAGPRKWSWRFQWLPCEVKFAEDSDRKVRITSYINNLRPDLHKDLYHTIEQVIESSIPTWNEVLLRSDHGRASRRIQPGALTYEPPGGPGWMNNLAENKHRATWGKDVERVREYCRLPEAPLPTDIDDRRRQFLRDREQQYPGTEPFDWEQWNDDRSDLWQIAYAKYLNIRTVVHPDPGPYAYNDWKEKQWDAKRWDFQYRKEGEEPIPYPVKLEHEFREKGLQVIVKLASIELSPDKPEYSGGSWHLEGSLSEHIVATSIYYFDVQNVSELRIRFRQSINLDTDQVRLDSPVRLCDFADLWGIPWRELRDETASVQEIGSIKTPQGRLLAFPNTLQHRVEPFKLVDTTKPGHRRFLVLWLVDLNYRILSTCNVPPQQSAWQADQAIAVLSRMQRPRLPPEVLAVIGDMLEELASVSMKRAQVYRRQLMKERATFAENIEATALRYTLCEH